MQCMEEDNLFFFGLILCVRILLNGMNFMVKYEGIFFDESMEYLILTNEKIHLGDINDTLHITFKYKPLEYEIFDEIVGNFYEIELIGYGCDGENSGFEVSLADELKKYYINFDEVNKDKLKTPHITTSLSKEAVPMNTKNLKFVPLEQPIKVKGRFGYWINDNRREYLSFEKYKKEN